jgi:hypothetical protein
VPTHSGALSYGDCKPGVVKACTLLPVDEPMICGPIAYVIAHQTPSTAAGPLAESNCETTARADWPGKRPPFAYPGADARLTRHLSQRPASATQCLYFAYFPTPNSCRVLALSQPIQRPEGDSLANSTLTHASRRGS